MKRGWFSFLVLCAACVSCGQVSRPAGNGTEASSPEKPGRIIVFSDSLMRAGHVDTIQLGRIHAGEKVKQDLSLLNDFSESLLILSVRTSCGCTQVEFPKTPILPGEQQPFSFTFDSRGFHGFQLKTITFSTSVSSFPCRLVLVGEVI